MNLGVSKTLEIFKFQTISIASELWTDQTTVDPLNGSNGESVLPLAPTANFQTMESPSSLRQRSNIIAQAVTDIETEYAKASASLPSLDEPFNPTNPAEAVGMQPAMFVTSSMIIGAAAQITATVSNPPLVVINNLLAVGVNKQGSAFIQDNKFIRPRYHLSSCLRAAAALNVQVVETLVFECMKGTGRLRRK